LIYSPISKNGQKSNKNSIAGKRFTDFQIGEKQRGGEFKLEMGVNLMDNSQNGYF
jgi:hypothetical protein